MAYLPSLQMLEEPVYPSFGDEQESMYDPYSIINIKEEITCKDSCSSLMASSLPSFDQTFFSPYSPDESHGLQNWTAQHPDHWTQQEVLNWLYYVVDSHNLDASRISGENFQNITGFQLCRMTREEFVQREPNFGDYIYDILQDLLKGATFTEPECDTPSSPDNLSMIGTTSFMEDTITDISNSTCTEDSIKVLIGGDLYDIDLKPIDLPSIELSIEPHDQGYWSDRESDCHSSMGDAMDIDTFTAEMYNQSYCHQKTRTYSDSQYSMSSDQSEEQELNLQPPPPKQNHRGRPKRVSKCNHLWEFIRDTLKDPQFNPTLLKWENKEEGVFRFVQSEAVAQMWGRKKNNTGMTYEKLSRAMRFCRTTGFFAEIPKTGKYPKKLCFKFGSKSFGWQE